jgi:hypothetical protein
MNYLLNITKLSFGSKKFFNIYFIFIYGHKDEKFLYLYFLKITYS